MRLHGRIRLLEEVRLPSMCLQNVSLSYSGKVEPKPAHVNWQSTPKHQQQQNKTMLTQTSDTWWHFLHHSTRSALCHTARTATSNGVVLQRLLRTLEAGEVLPWGDGDGTAAKSALPFWFSNSSSLSSFNLSINVHFNLNTFGHALLFPALAEKVFDLRSPSA